MSVFDSQLHRIKGDWQERPESERRVLTIVGVLMLVCAVYFLIVEPVEAYKEKQQRLLAAENNKYSRVVPLVERIKARSSDSDSGQLSGGLAKLIDNSLQENGLTMRGFQPGKNNDARLRLSDVPYESLVQWLYDLEYKHNVVVEEMSVSPSKETTLLLVNIRIKKG
jgi:general secretion pathway protein M